MSYTTEIIKKEIRKTVDFIFALGYFSEIIMAIIVVYVLWIGNDTLSTLIFILFFLFSGFLNTIFKRIIREPRPNDAIKFLYSEHFSRIHTIYGMPSGHSQNVFFSIVYLYLSTNESVHWLQIGLVMATLMAYERLSFHNHTVLQLMVGAIIGSLFGIIVAKLRDWIRYKLYKNNKGVPQKID